MEPECEPKLVALALQHFAQGWVATEENCDLGENMDSKCLYNHMLADNKRVSAFCVINFHIVVCLAQHSLQTGSHLADLLLSDLCKHLAKNVLKKLQKTKLCRRTLFQFGLPAFVRDFRPVTRSRLPYVKNFNSNYGIDLFHCQLRQELFCATIVRQTHLFYFHSAKRHKSRS